MDDNHCKLLEKCEIQRVPEVSMCFVLICIICIL